MSASYTDSIRIRMQGVAVGYGAHPVQSGIDAQIRAGEIFAIVGDSGLNEPQGSEFWAEANRRMSIAFRRGAFGEGIVGALRVLGERMSKRFPSRPGLIGTNQVENEISTEDTA